MAETVQYYGTGRRKSSVARVFLRPGTGDFTVNGRAFDQFFVTDSQRGAAKQPLVSSETAATFNVVANASGCAITRQADAVRMRIVRALLVFNAEFRKKLKAVRILSLASRR